MRNHDRAQEGSSLSLNTPSHGGGRPGSDGHLGRMGRIPILVCALTFLGCSGADCPTLAARYAAAVAAAKQCVPGQDTCSGRATAVSTFALPDRGVEISIDNCMNGCGGESVNPARTGDLRGILAEYRANQCGGLWRDACARNRSTAAISRKPAARSLTAAACVVPGRSIERGSSGSSRANTDRCSRRRGRCTCTRSRVRGATAARRCRRSRRPCSAWCTIRHRH